MKKDGFCYRVYDLYSDGFRSMTLGKVLWSVIIIKIVVLVVVSFFFFPDYIKEHSEQGGEADFVASELVERAIP